MSPTIVFVIGLVVGLFIGANFGVVVMGRLCASARDDACLRGE